MAGRSTLLSAVRRKRLGVVLAAAALVASCGQAPSEQTGGDATGPIKIGISLPLTGEYAQPGVQAMRGYQVWTEMVNAQGGLLGRKVQLKITDDASSQDTVVADYTRLITQEEVDLLLGTFSSLLNYPASAVAEKYQMLYIEPAGGAPNIFMRGFNYLIYSQPGIATRQADAFVEWVRSLPEAQRPQTAAYPTMDDPFTRPVLAALSAKLEKLGVKTVYESIYPADTTNFQTIATAIAKKKPDLIAQGAVFEDGIGLVRSLQQLNYSPQVLFQTSAPSNRGQYSGGIGVRNTQGIFYTVSWNEKADVPMNQAFVSKYRQMYNGEMPAEDAADAFAAGQVLQAAVEGVGRIDQKALADWLHSHSVQTILGELNWDERGAPQSEFLLAQWQNGQPQIVSPEHLATTENVIHPKPDWH